MSNNLNCADAEWQLRLDLAACYRLFVHYGWTDLIYTHLSARVPDTTGEYLINPYGLLFHEISASNLIKVNFDGEVLAGDYPFNHAGHAIHTAVLKARPEVNAVLHSHTRAGIAVSCMQSGLQPMSQHANEIIALVAYHDYDVASHNPEECDRLGEDMSDKWAMIMRNHGLLSAGRTVSEAFYYLYMLEMACKIQVDVMASGAEIVMPKQSAQDRLQQESLQQGAGPADHIERTWQAVIRMLDEKDGSWRS